MVTLVDGLFGVSLLAGVLLCWTGAYTVRRWDALGVVPFGAFIATLGAGGILTALTGLFLLETDLGSRALWTQIAVLLWALSAVPWFLFALQYTGRYTRLGWRLVAFLFVPFLGIVANTALSVVGISGFTLPAIIGSLVFTYALALVLVGAYLLVRTTYAYGHLSWPQGVSLAVAPTVLFLAVNTTSAFPDATGAGAAGTYTAGLTLATLAVGVSLVRYPLFDVTAAVGTIGERAIVRETDDLVFVVDDRGHVIKLNETAVETLAVDRASALDTPLSDLVGHSADDLDRLETVMLQTVGSGQQYDPQVSTITAHDGRELGAMCSLRDVTDRELREQRLAVLNRVLRHNLRNKTEVVRSRAEALTNGDAAQPERATAHAETIAETADEIADLGKSARTIDQFVSEDSGESRVELGAAVADALDATEEGREDLTVSVETPDSSQVVTNRRALDAALRSAIDNAFAYADSTVSVTVERRANGYQITIADDGPGIPAGELESLERGTETPLQHGTGLGLWQLKWAVTTLNGELSFDTTDGTTVEILVPDRRG
jgi:signal transduction histidine kinase